MKIKEWFQMMTLGQPYKYLRLMLWCLLDSIVMSIPYGLMLGAVYYLLAPLAQPDFVKAKASSTDFIDRLPSFLRPAAKKIATPTPKIRKYDCVGCGRCAESCPQHTIQIREGKAVIDYKNCIRCFCCHEMCPKHVIDIRRWSVLHF